VSFHQRTSLFEVFGAGVADFHERFFLVRPRTETTLQSVLKIVDRPRGEGGVAPVHVPRIHFSWSRDHLKHEHTMYRISSDKLTERNKDSFAKLVRFVNFFSRSMVVDDGCDPVMDLRGNPVTKPRLIDTRSLVFSKDPLTLLGMLMLCFLLPFRLLFMS
jgi:hypothetical protein